jgi:hypothetical protein
VDVTGFYKGLNGSMEEIALYWYLSGQQDLTKGDFFYKTIVQSRPCH